MSTEKIEMNIIRQTKSTNNRKKNVDVKNQEHVLQISEEEGECVESLRNICKHGTAKDIENLLPEVDPNVEFQKSRPIHWAAECGNVQVLTVLLRDSRINTKHVNGYRRTALHLAARGGNHEVLKLLLEIKDGGSIDVNAVDKKGRTAFHLAAETPIEGYCTEGRFLRCLALLLDRPELDVNKPDLHGRTAISRALWKSHEKRVLTILQHCGEHKLNLDYCLADGGKTVREKILDNFPEFIPLLPEPLMENISSSEPEIRLLAMIQHDLLEEFKCILQENIDIVNKQIKKPYHCTCLELACIMKGREKFAVEILSVVPDPNVKNQISGIPLLHTTAESLNIPLLSVLLDKEGIKINERGLNQGTVLHWLSLNKCAADEVHPLTDKCFSLLLQSSADKLDLDAKDCRGDTPLHVAVRWGNLDMAVNLLIAGASVNAWNNNKHTPLHVAAFSENKDTALTLLKYGADIDAQDGRGTPLHVAVQLGKKDVALLLLKQGANFMCEAQGGSSLQYIDPVILETFFDDCVQCNGKNPKNSNYMLIFKYNFIPAVKEVSDVPLSDFVMRPLLKMSEMPEMRHLLKHPLLSSVLFLKWRYTCFAVYLHIILYTIFLITLTLHIVFVTSHKASRTSVRQSVFMCQYFENSLNTMLWIFVFLIIGREVVQFIMDKYEYLRNGRNIVDFTLVGSTFIVCWNCNTQFTRHAAAIAILLAWIEFFLLIGRLPSISVQLEMLKKVCLTFLKFGLCYSPIIIAFALSFHIIFEGEHTFIQDGMFSNDSSYILNKTTGSFLSLFQTFVMFTGEFEAKDLRFSSTPITSHFVFICFVFLIALALLNLLNGLAVSDTQTIIDDAETLSLVARAKLVLQMETIVLHCKRRLFFRDCLKGFCFFFGDLPDKRLYIYPNSRCEVMNRPRGKVLGTMATTIVSRAVTIATRNNSKS